MITQATTSGNARQVLASAKTETVNLRRKLASGKYNDREVRAAIRHAERMERVAKKRMKHLQQEEYIEKHGGGTWQNFLDEECPKPPAFLKESGAKNFTSGHAHTQPESQLLYLYCF